MRVQGTKRDNEYIHLASQSRSEQLGTVDAAYDAAVRRSDLNQHWSIVSFVKPHTQTQIEFIIILACFEEASQFFSTNRPGGQTAKTFAPLVNEITKIMTKHNTLHIRNLTYCMQLLPNFTPKILHYAATAICLTPNI